jgi:hypothetical protein
MSGWKRRYVGRRQWIVKVLMFRTSQSTFLSLLVPVFFYLLSLHVNTTSTEIEHFYYNNTLTTIAPFVTAGAMVIHGIVLEAMTV